MADARHCTHCGVEITDPTTRVLHGGVAYCCANCSHRMEEGSGGSDPQAGGHENALRCAHCGTAIVDESTMQSRGDDAFCCANCQAAMSAAPR